MPENEPTIRFRLDSRSGLAPYRQIVDQVDRAVRFGALRAGDRLPSVREVVSQITINPNTVHRAYRELEAMDLAEGRQGLGTFVSAGAAPSTTSKQQAVLETELRRWVRKARSAGMDDEGIVGMVINVTQGVPEGQRGSDGD